MNSRVRYLFGFIMIAAGLFLAYFLFHHRPSSTTSDSYPRQERSILLITMDTTRADRLQPYGCEDVETPVLQALADNGILFESAYAVAPLTLPAHTSILSGKIPPHTGVRNNGVNFVPEDIPVLAEILGREGYRTAAFVSASVLERRYGLARGFELYDDDLSTSAIRAPRVVPDRPAGATVASVTEWLDGLGDGEKYFAWVHFYDPHAMYNPPPPFRDSYRGRFYEGEIAYMDSQIGVLLSHPKIASAGEPIIVAMGDHGESLGEHGEKTHGTLAYDSTLHVPWIMRLPDGPKGLRVDMNVTQVDLLPTLLDALGMGASDDADGISLLPLLGDRNLAGQISENRPIYGECYLPFNTYGWSKLQTVRLGKSKLIEESDPEMFDLQRDPKELTDLISEDENMVYDLRQALAEVVGAGENSEREARLEVDADAAERLAALGYLAVNDRPVEVEGERPSPKDMVDVHVGIEQARFFAANRLFDEAVEELQKVLEKDPGNLAAMADLAGHLYVSGRLDEAVEVVERSLALDPQNSRTLLFMAKIEMGRKQPEKALALMDSVLEVIPKSTDARIMKARLLNRLDRREDTVALMEEVLADDPEAPAALVAVAELVDLPAGDIENAEIHLRQAAARDPFMDSSWITLGEVLEQKGLKEEAVEAYRSGLAKTPDSVELHAHLGIVMARTAEIDEARGHLEEAIRLSPTFLADVHITLGALLADSGEKKAAATQFEMVLAQDPKNPGARNNLALAHLGVGDFVKAEEELRELVRNFPRHADALNNLAALALRRQDWADAVVWGRRSVEANPALADGWNNLGYALQRQGGLSEAEDCFKKALERSPSHWQALLNLGGVQAAGGRAKEAAETFRRLVKTQRNLPDGHYALGDLYLGPLGDPAKARLYYQAAVKLNPRHPRAQEINRLIPTLPLSN